MECRRVGAIGASVSFRVLRDPASQGLWRGVPEGAQIEVSAASVVTERME